MLINDYIKILIVIFTVISGCSVHNYPIQNQAENGKYICPVCDLKIPLESESFDQEYYGKLYLFDYYECRWVFKRNPEKFIKNE